MLADAIRAESYRLGKNRTTLFWSVAFLPVMGVIMAAIGNLFLKSNSTKITVGGKAPPELVQMLTGGPLNLITETVNGVSDMANPTVLLFVLIAAAAVYAGDYRWETWRLISARNSRTNLLLGKVGTLGGLVLVAMLILMIGDMIETVLKSVQLDRELTVHMTDGAVGQFFAYAGLSWLAIMQFTMVGLLAAVMTRSLLATLFVPLVIGVAQFFSPEPMARMGFMPDDWAAVLVNPGAAFGYLKAAVAGGQAAEMLPDGAIVKGVASVVLWTAGPLIAALAWFGRQDLSKE